MRLDTGGEAVFGYSTQQKTLFFQRDGQNRKTAPLPLRNDHMKLHIFIDRCVVEMFGGDGEVTLTALLNPDTVCEGLSLYATGGNAHVKKLDIWKLHGF